jgi:putative ABC transport system permease protein
MRGIWQDISYGFRQFRKSPGFTLVAVASLALGIGANTAIFSVVNGVLLRPLPYDEPERVVHLLAVRQGELDFRHIWLAYPEIEDMREMSEGFAHVSAIRSWSPVLYGSGEPTRLRGGSVSASFFQIFGMQPALGRYFLPEEEELGHEPVVVLSHGFWQQQYGGDPAALGATLDLDGVRYEVVGVAPANLVDPSGSRSLWRSRPPGWDATRLARINHSWRAIGRLADGVALDQAQADLDRVWLNLAEEYPQAHAGEQVRLVEAKEWMVGGVRTAVLILLGAVGLVLLIACANVANLLLTRTAVRSREMALRAALGAGWGRLIRQLLTEVCLLFLLGGVVGLYLAWAGTDLLLALGGQNLPRHSEIGIDATVLVFTLAITLLTAMVFGMTSAYRAARSDLASALQVGGQRMTGDRSSQRLRSGLVVAEIALSLVLLAGGGLLLKSFWNLQRVGPGFRAENVLTLLVNPRPGDYSEPEQMTRLYEDILERAGSLPEVRATGAINILPMTGGQNCEFVWRDDRPFPSAEDYADYDGPTCLEVRVVSPGYFQAMGMTLVEGRGFSSRDDEIGPPVAVVNEGAAQLGFPAEEVLGKRLTIYETRDWIPNVSREIVGVVRNIRQIALAAEPTVAIYVPHAQELDPGRRRAMTLVLRTERDPTDVAAAVRAVVRDVDENLSISFVRSMESVVANTVARPRFRTVLLLIFAGVALLLSAVGVAGIVGYAVSQRVPEIGLRKALGAQDRDIYSMVMGQGVRLTAAGLLIGLVGSVAATRLLSGLLYGVSATDPATFLAVALLLAAIALTAIWIPARKALRVDPVEVLNAE